MKIAPIVPSLAARHGGPEAHAILAWEKIRAPLLDVYTDVFVSQ